LGESLYKVEITSFSKTWVNLYQVHDSTFRKTIFFKIHRHYLLDCPTIGTLTRNISLLSHNVSQRDALFLKFIFYKELYMFRTNLLSIVRSINTVYTAIGICHAEILKVDIKNKFDK